MPELFSKKKDISDDETEALDSLMDTIILFLDSLNEYIESNEFAIDINFKQEGGKKYSTLVKNNNKDFKYKYQKYKAKYLQLKHL